MPNCDTVAFRLAQPYAPFLKWLDEDNEAILPAHIYQGTDPPKNRPTPSRSAPGRSSSSLRSRATTSRWCATPTTSSRARPYLDRLVFGMIPGAQALQAFQASEVGLLPGLAPPDLKVLQSRQDVTITENGREAFALVIRLIPNLKRKPFDDVWVRQAMAYAIDR